MRNLKVMLALSCVMFSGCGILKEINYVTVCAEPGLLVELSRFGKYKVNDKVVTKEEADGICLTISQNQSRKYEVR